MAPVRANLAVAFVLCFAMVWRMAAWKGKGTGLASLASGIPPSSSSVLAVNETLRTRELADVVHRVATAVSAASMIQGTAKLADESQDPFPQDFDLQVTIKERKITDLSGYLVSTWDEVTIPTAKMKKWCADSTCPGQGYRFAYIVDKVGGGTGMFAYMDSSGTVTHTGDVVAQGKATLHFNRVGEASFMNHQTRFATTIDPHMKYASHFAWIAPKEMAGGPGAFVYKWDKSRAKGANLFKELNWPEDKELYVQYDLSRV